MWVVLVVRILNEEKDRGCNIASLRKCLDQIPSELHKLFEDILQRGVRDDPNLVPILQWISFARRPLACEELYLAVRSDQADYNTAKPWDPDEDDSDTMKLFILNSSKGLAELTRGKSPTVQFIHESVRDYLRETGFRVLAPNLHGHLLRSTHEYLKRCCGQWMTADVVKHLALPEILPKAKSQDARETRTRAAALFPFLEYSVSNLIYHAELADGAGLSQARFIESFPLKQWVTINNVFAIHDTRRYFPPFDALLCILGDKVAPGLLAIVLQLPSFRAVAVDVFQLALRHAQGADWLIINRTGYSPLMRASEYGYVSSVQKHLEGGAAVNPRDSMNQTALVKACLNGHAAVVQLLIEHGAELDSPHGLNSIPLTIAAEHGHGTTVQILIRHGAALHIALEIACSTGNESAVSMLLENDANARLPCGQYTNPVLAAFETGHESIARLLLAKPHGSNLYGLFLDRLLCLVCSKGHLACVSILLFKGANSNATDCSKRTALSLACLGRYDSIVRMLLSNGADVNPESEYWRSPLMQACIGGSKGVIQLLLTQRVRTSPHSASLEPAHHEASSNEIGTSMREVLGNGAQGQSVSEELVLWLSKLRLDKRESIANLLANGDVPKACNLPIKGLLFMTSMHGFHDMVQSLLQNGAEFSAEEHFHALSVACRRGHGLAVKTLIANGPRSVVRLANDYREIVQLAVVGRHGYILETLLDQSESFRAQSRETFTEALRQATQLGFNEIVNILCQRGVTLPEDSD
jgi:ankyrin repeat protein